MKARCAAAVAVAALIAAPAARADYKESYRKGMEAVDRGNWAEVARWMRQAASEQPKEGERLKLYGMRFEPYLPNYYLGLALFNAGDCEGAVQAFRASEGQGAVQKGSGYKTLAKNKGACETRMAQAKPRDKPPPAGPDPAAVAQAAKAAEASVADAEQHASAAAALQSDPAVAAGWAQEGALGGAQKQAADLLAGAKAKLDSGRRKPDLGELQQAQEMAARSALQFEGVTREAGARRAAARRAADARKPEPLPTPGPAASPGKGGPPAELLAAARAYFGGNYREAAALLDGVQYPTARTAAQAALLRAASRHALFLLSGQKDDRLKQQALLDVKACRRADSAFAPEPRFFSPRFTEFFRAVRP